MNDKEKQAIETIKDRLFHYKLNKKMGLLDKMTEQGRNECEVLEIVLNIIEKQNNIINKMAEQLTTPIHSKEWVIEYYTKKAETEEK